MSNSLDHVKKIKNESIIKAGLKESSKFNLDIINENDHDMGGKNRRNDTHDNSLKVKDSHD